MSSTFFPTDYTLTASSSMLLSPPSPISPAAATAAGCSSKAASASLPRPSFFRRQSSSFTARAEDSPLTPLASAQQPSSGAPGDYFPHSANADAALRPSSPSPSTSRMSRSVATPYGENREPTSSKTTSPPSNDRRQRQPAPPPIKIAPPHKSTFLFPPSPTDDESSPPSDCQQRPSVALVLPTPHDSHYTIPPSPTPPVSPKVHDSELPVIARPRPQSSQSSLRQSRKASFVDGQLFGDYCGEACDSSPLPSPSYEGAMPRRMSVAGSGTRRRSSMGHGHPGSTGYASFTSCINGASSADLGP